MLSQPPGQGGDVEWKTRRPGCWLGSGGPPGVQLAESHAFVCVSQAVFRQLVGSLRGQAVQPEAESTAEADSLSDVCAPGH